MELKFENTSTLDKNALLTMNLSSRNPVFTAAVLVVSVYFLFSAVRSAIGGALSGLLTGLLYTLILAGFWYLLPRAQASLEYRRNSMAYSRDPKCIYYSGIWQELGLKESAVAEEWAKRVILDE